MVYVMGYILPMPSITFHQVAMALSRPDFGAFMSRIVALKYSADSVRAALVALKGAERGPATFEAVAPVFSALIASGGSKAELSATTATAQVFRELHAETLKTSTGRAWRAVCPLALADFKANGRAADQAAHDARMVALSGTWCTYFKDAAPKAKPEGPTLREQLAAAQSAVAALTIERDAYAAQLAQCQQALAEAQKVPDNVTA